MSEELKTEVQAPRVFIGTLKTFENLEEFLEYTVTNKANGCIPTKCNVWKVFDRVSVANLCEIARLCPIQSTQVVDCIQWSSEFSIIEFKEETGVANVYVTRWFHVSFLKEMWDAFVDSLAPQYISSSDIEFVKARGCYETNGSEFRFVYKFN